MKEILEEANWPSVSVLVAARNEEESIGKCLTALQHQKYPGQLEVWVANDHSEDKTAEIVERFCEELPGFQLVQVPDSDSHVKGKALALGLMARQAKGEIFLVCDADMEMPEGWIYSMVNEMKTQNVDLINGTTTTKGESIFSILQGIDWLLPQGTFAWMSQLNITYTAMGNNMAISRKAYEATGGYLKLPFSLTEDFELFKHAKEKGFRLIHYFNSSVLGYSEPEKTVSDWLTQHVRWMVGFMQLPFSQQWVFYIQLLFYPLFFVTFLFENSVATGLVQGPFLLKMVYEAVLLAVVGRWKFIFWLPLYQIVWWPFYMTCFFKFHFSKTIVWKDRVWEK
jgi:cellulose synthase/poly-beta-1,6-N-acetylglucosamine synthase-like glycosyltransferase